MIGGVRVDERMATTGSGLYAAGEVAGGAHGANRISGNALTEAVTFGARAGTGAAAQALRGRRRPDTTRSEQAALTSLADLLSRRGDTSPAAVRDEVQRVMWSHVGPFRTATGLGRALARLDELAARELAHLGIAGPPDSFNLDAQETLNLDHALLTARAVAQAALARRESRGAHQREDHPETGEAWVGHHVQALAGGRLEVRWRGRS
jgi:succinate dehydrogenase/fumarate reductase flavoprotein subunit